MEPVFAGITRDLLTGGRTWHELVMIVPEIVARYVVKAVIR